MREIAGHQKIFIYGLSGAGKDTIADYLSKTYGFYKLRIAGTIKHIIYESYGLTSREEFENIKRNYAFMRKEHNNIGNLYDKRGLDISGREASINRCIQLANGTALDYDIFPNKEKSNIVICDVRTREEIDILLRAGFIGIFLTRNTRLEYSDKNHKTENQNVLPDLLTELYECKVNPEILKDQTKPNKKHNSLLGLVQHNMYFIDNDDSVAFEWFDKYHMKNFKAIKTTDLYYIFEFVKGIVSTTIKQQISDNPNYTMSKQLREDLSFNPQND